MEHLGQEDKGTKVCEVIHRWLRNKEAAITEATKALDFGKERVVLN